MKSLKIIPFYIFIGIVTVFFGMTVKAQTGSVSDPISVMIPDTVVIPGESVTIPIITDTLTNRNIISYDFRLIYDPDFLEYRNVKTQETLSRNVSVMTNSAAPGTLVVAAMGFSQITGTGTLLNLKFNVGAQTMGSSALRFEQFSFNGGNPPSTAINGTVRTPNNPPSAFSVLNSDLDANLVIDATNLNKELALNWEAATDAEGNPIQYGLVLNSPDLQTIPVETTPFNNLSITYARLADSVLYRGLQSWDGTWTIYATDGADTTYADNGPFSLQISLDATGVESGNSIPQKTQIFPNYPNPFNPSTTIRYQIATPAFVSINVYDVSGRLVAELVNDSQPAGEYTVTWTGTNTAGQMMPTGTYFYRLKTSDGSMTRKMSLIK